MKIAIVGAGGVGGYLGALLARTGHDVALIARGEHLRAIREHGIRVESVHGDYFTARPALVTDRPSEVGQVDLIVFTVKTYDTDEAAAAARPLAGAETLVLPLQNGVESAIRLAPVFGAVNILAGATWIVASVAASGVIRQESQVRRIVFGAPAGRTEASLEPVREELASTGFAVAVSDRIEEVLWTKFVFIASLAGLTSVIRAPLGPILARPEARQLLLRAMEEVESVARARGVALDPDVIEKTMAFAESLEPSTTSSMARDVAAGRRTEAAALSGAVVRAGREARIPTPVHDFCWGCLRVLDPHLS